jgi:hypothetical protein
LCADFSRSSSLVALHTKYHSSRDTNLRAGTKLPVDSSRLPVLETRHVLYQDIVKIIE